jgi:hypothetical protein
MCVWVDRRRSHPAERFASADDFVVGIYLLTYPPQPPSRQHCSSSPPVARPARAPSRRIRFSRRVDLTNEIRKIIITDFRGRIDARCAAGPAGGATIRDVIIWSSSSGDEISSISGVQVSEFDESLCGESARANHRPTASVYAGTRLDTYGGERTGRGFENVV